MRYLKQQNKKGQSTNAQIFLIIVALLLMTLSIFFSFRYTASAKTQIYDSAPEITYDFPNVFTHTFLFIEINEEEKEKLNLIISNKYFVKDLVIIRNEQNVTQSKIIDEILEEKRTEYINLYDTDKYNIYENYQDFSKNTIFKDDLLKFEFDLENLPNLEEYIEANNYFYYFLNKDGKYNVIYFKS